MIDGEEKLIISAVKGNSSAFGALYDYYQPMIYRFIAVKVSRREEAEDLTHQVFLSAWQSIKSYKHRGHPFSSWLYQIARNQVIDHYRSQKRETSLEGVDPEELVAGDVANIDLSLRLDMGKVHAAIKKLKPEYQDVIILRFI